MADNRTGLSAADLAAQFRDVCGDGSMEWVSMAWQTWVLLDAADMLEEFADTPKCETCEAMLDCDECLRADASQKERKRLDYENAKLRELVNVFYHCTTSGYCDECPVNGGGRVHLMPDTICDTLHDCMRELGVEVEQ